MRPRMNAALRAIGWVLLVWLTYHAVSLVRVLPLEVYECGEWRGRELALMIVVFDLPLLLAGMLLLLGVRRPWAYLLTPLAIGVVYVRPQLHYFRLISLAAAPCALGIPRWEWLLHLSVGIDAAIAALCLWLAGWYWRGWRLQVSR